jgi:hypothetical protein
VLKGTAKEWTCRKRCQAQQEFNNGIRNLGLKRVITSGKQENTQQDLQADCRTGDHEANSQVFCQDSKNKCQNIVEEPATAQTKEEIEHNLRAMDVGALITLGTFAHTDRKKDLYCLHPMVYHDVKRKMMAVNLNQLAPYEGTAEDEWPKGWSSGSTWRVITMRNEPWGGR